MMVSMAKRTDKPSEKPALIAQLYSVGEWSGLPQYKCTLCSFDSMRLDAMQAHITAVHLPAVSEPKRIQSILVADKNGNVVDPANDVSLVGVYEIDLEEVTNDGTNNDH